MAPVSATTPGSLGSWPYSWTISTSGPPLEKRRSRRREPGHRSLGTAAHQGEALAIEGQPHREADTFGRIPTPSMCPHGLRAEKRRTQIHPVPQGGFHKAGEGPAFGDSFVYFSSLRNRPQRSASPWRSGQTLLSSHKGAFGHKKLPHPLEKVWKFFVYWVSPWMMAMACSTSSSRPARMPSKVGSHHTSG